jgi:DNA-directed RNA polymerase specialized sigma24 family protein
MPELHPDWIDHANAVAVSTCRRWSPFVERDELVNELWMYAVRNVERVNEMIEPPDAYTISEDGEVVVDVRLVRAAHRRLEKRMASYAERYARRAKAEQSGYHWLDEFFYSAQLVEDLLPVALSAERDPALLPDDDAVSTKRKRSLLSEGGNLPAMCADIQGAVSRLPEQQREVLVAVYGQGERPVDVAAAVGVSRQAVEARINRAVRGIVSALGGDDPGMGTVGSRRVVSNAQARVETDRQA